ncbi:hypothetical protein E2562_009449 [Oryza meyeriana var. granulata]|uniref:Uncharacterized protein n=1 Tax=Oryza meyeriana var. granulata TaxID=110450 RepID=A0A6G1BTX3_9ORYZ|nr:hypothetical protein E2562_009449 [Oryza meyeriana var. granulata]
MDRHHQTEGRAAVQLSAIGPSCHPVLAVPLVDQRTKGEAASSLGQPHPHRLAALAFPRKP